MDTKLTEEDKNMLMYFWREKGDPTRWCGWDKAKAIMEEEKHPYLDAWESLKRAEKIMDLYAMMLED
jgi:hypothetical protein